jgi:hypothetical protein
LPAGYCGWRQLHAGARAFDKPIVASPTGAMARPVMFHFLAYEFAGQVPADFLALVARHAFHRGCFRHVVYSFRAYSVLTACGSRRSRPPCGRRTHPVFPDFAGELEPCAIALADTATTPMPPRNTFLSSNLLMEYSPRPVVALVRVVFRARDDAHERAPVDIESSARSRRPFSCVARAGCQNT